MQCYGEKGLIKKAQQAKEMHEKSVQQEEEATNQLIQEYENAMPEPSTTGPNGKPLVNKDTVSSTNHSKIIGEDEKGNQVVVPKGFKIADDSGSNVEDGIVIEDDEGNQFVWIPVSNINHDGTNKIIKNDGSEVEITLGRYTFARTKNSTTGLYEDGTPTKVQYGSEYAATTAAAVKDGTNTTAKDLQAFIESARDNHGYYLARYEASHSSTDTTKPASKVADVWEGAIQSTAAKASRNMYSGNTKVEVESDLCNSYGWDTAIVYIQAMGHSNYANEDKDTTGNTSPLKTGETGDEVCKMFDMAANCYEWTTEYSACMDSLAFHNTARGGYSFSSSGFVSSRGFVLASSHSSYYSFRVSLYL